MTPSRKGTKRKVPPALKKVRKQIPPPSRVFGGKKKYNRRRAKEEIKRGLREGARS